MRLHCGGDVAPVATGHVHHHRDAALAQNRQHAPVALGQAGMAELEAAQAVALVRVGAGQVEGQAGRAAAVQLPLPGLRQRGIQRGQVGRVGAAVGLPSCFFPSCSSSVSDSTWGSSGG